MIPVTQPRIEPAWKDDKGIKFSSKLNEITARRSTILCNSILEFIDLLEINNFFSLTRYLLYRCNFNLLIKIKNIKKNTIKLKRILQREIKIVNKSPWKLLSL